MKSTCCRYGLHVEAKRRYLLTTLVVEHDEILLLGNASVVAFLGLKNNKHKNKMLENSRIEMVGISSFLTKKVDMAIAQKNQRNGIVSITILNLRMRFV
jgi:hypothetical protein